MRLWGQIQKRMRRHKLNNDGAAMVTMIVVVLFITILATTLLYISGMNFQIKQTEYRNQKSFYAGETSLENIKARLMADSSKAAADAYSQVMSEYVTLGIGDARTWEYQQIFLQNLQDNWTTSTGGDWKSFLASFCTAGATLDIPGRDANGDGVLSNSEMLEIHDAEGYLIVKGLEVTYTNSEGYTSVIKTDFYVQAPTMNWGVEKSETAAPADPLAAQATKEIEAATYVQYVNWQKQ